MMHGYKSMNVLLQMLSMLTMTTFINGYLCPEPSCICQTGVV